MKAILTGATGMIGNLVLRHCLESEDIKQVISVTRRAGSVHHEKLTELIPDSFLDYQGQESLFKDADMAFFCLGAYTGAVPDDLFKEITLNYVEAFADVLKAESPEVNFSLLSGAGADQTGKSNVSFAKYKGMAENFLIGKNFKHLHLFRPGYIYPVQKRKEPNLAYRIFRSLYPLFSLFGKKYSIKSTELAAAMFKAGLHPAQKTVLENDDILEFLSTT